MEDAGIFYDHFTDIWYILCPFVIFHVFWYIFRRFGMFYQVKSGINRWLKRYRGFESL
jgi:hypothetical protein